METYPLLPNTGVQYLELPGLFTDQDMKQRRGLRRFSVKPAVSAGIALVDHRAGAAAAAGRKEEGFGGDEEEEDLDSPQPAQQQKQSDAVVADLAVAMDLIAADKGWLPIPFNAPSCLWAQMWITPTGTGAYDAVLAIDTTVTAHGEGGTIPEGCIAGTMEIEPVRLAPFWTSQPVLDYVERHYTRRQKSRGRGPAQALSESRGGLQAHLAGFYCMLAEMDKFPRITIQQPDDPVDVNVVVDLGNSRTCCVINEIVDGREEFVRLQLRDPRRPLGVYADPAQTRLAFVPPARGVLAGAATFQDLSIIRYGKFALDLLGQSSEDFGRRGMSSPKRYMWDGSSRPEAWQLAVPPLDNPQQKTIHGPLLGRMDLARPFDEPQILDPKPLNPDYARKSGILFLLIEIMEQAYRQINSVEHRGALVQKPNCRSRRIIRNLVLMHPDGMHSDEVREFKRAANRSCRLWSDFRNDQAGFLKTPAPAPAPAAAPGSPPPPPKSKMKREIPIPNVIQDCDEGLAIQICFLYGEALHRFQGEPKRLMGALVGKDKAEEDKPLRIASLDIGGGTIDLAIADYLPDKQAVQASFEYKRLFNDGISMAGDDIARRIIERLIFPAIVDQMGLSMGEWNRLFSASASLGATDWPTVRRNLVSLVWQPLIHGCWQRLERGQNIDAKVEELLDVTNDVALKTLDAKLKSIPDSKRQGRGEFEKSVRTVRLRFNQQDVYKIVNFTIGAVLRQYCDIISQYRCDVLVLGGRPSALPAVRRLVTDSLPVPPGALIFLHEQHLGDWFPFTVAGRVGDAKTCGVVGAAIHFSALFGRSMFVLREFQTEEEKQRKRRKRKHIPSILGILNPLEMRLKDEITLFPKEEETLSEPIRFDGNFILIGGRRVRGSHALASPIYRVVRHPDIEKHLKRRPMQNQPLAVRLERRFMLTDEQGQPLYDEEAGEPITAEPDILRVGEMEGKLRFEMPNGQMREEENNPKVLKCELQTMLDSDYWLDSGCFGEVKAP